MKIKKFLFFLIIFVMVLTLVFSIKWFRAQRSVGPGNLFSATAEIIEEQENNNFTIKVIKDDNFSEGELIILHANSNVRELKNEDLFVTTLKKGDLIRFTYDEYQKNDDNQIIIFSDDIIKYSTKDGTD